MGWIMDRLSLALWAVNMAAAPRSLDEVDAGIDAKLAEAAHAGASMLMLPEYISEQWLAFAPPGLPETEEVAWMGERGVELLGRLRPLPARHGVALLTGSWPGRRGAGWVNRAHLMLPDSRIIAQDKLQLTPSEKDPLSWMIEPGGEVAIVEWQGLRIAMLICLDVEQPALAAKLQGANLDLLLVPSMTTHASGHARVMSCAKARAVELMTTVAAVGCIGSAAVHPPRPNTGGAAVYIPCEPSLGHAGTSVEALWAAQVDGAGPLVIARDLPVATIRELRHSGAEVWTGAWPAVGVTVREV
jgi:predicted amidohydrolase